MTKREWSTNGRTFSATGIYCSTPGHTHVWKEMGEDGGMTYFVCDVCGCWSRK